MNDGIHQSCDAGTRPAFGTVQRLFWIAAEAVQGAPRRICGPMPKPRYRAAKLLLL
ncbi:hypothetical protein [Sphingomonas kyungheensis]|uniref:Transposase n=1 Tax=Sphingomonas kyungheensis TaxID=1069987 RepID=A0ABU8H1Q3_9SPHN